MTRLVRIGVIVGAALVFAACGGGNGKNDAGSAGGGAGGGAAGGGVGGGAGGGQGNCSPSCFTGQVCDPATNTCVECVTGFDCTDPAKPTCDTTTHTCTSGAGGGSGGGAGGGGGSSVANDDCTTALTLNFVNGTATVSGDTTNANNSNVLDGGAPSCTTTARTEGNDLLYQYTLTTAKDVDITVTPTSTSQLEPVLYIRKPGACTGTQDTDELACDATFDPTTPAHAKLFNQQPGTYSVWVDSTSGTSGAFDLKAVLSGPTLPPANDTCAMASPITLTNNTGTATVDLSAATDDETGSCAQFAKGGDVVYSVDVGTTPMDLTVTVGPNPSTGSADPVVYIKQGTCTGTEQACSDNGFSGDPETAKVSFASGVYYVFVKDYSPSTAGPVTVTVTLSTPIPGDSCNNPLTLDLTTNTSQNVSVDTTNLVGSYDSDNCNYAGVTGPDSVYAVTIPANRLFDVYAKPTKGADGGSSYDPLVYVRGSPCASGTEVSCSDTYVNNQAELTTVRNTDGGTYYVFVDGYGSSSGIADVAFRSYPGAAAPANDLCRDVDGGLTATPLVLSTAATGDNNGALDEAYMGCNGGGAEVFFQVTPLPTATQLTATVTATSSGFLPAVAIRTPGSVASRVCEGGSTDPNIACVVSDGGSVTTATAAVDGGSYIIVIEGANGTRGTFTVTAQ